MLQTAGFNLRKWASNVPELAVEQNENLQINKEETTKSLGMLWNTKEDFFRFKVNLIDNHSNTKRAILSDIAKLFDPLGWLAPTMVTAKLLIQELWIRDLDWDKAVPNDIEEKWMNYRSQSPILGEIRIPRWINYHKTTTLQLHGFADASEKAYAAVIYARIKDNDGNISTKLLIAKSKVAPIKIKKTLPRLELCGASLLARLMKQVINR